MPRIVNRGRMQAGPAAALFFLCWTIDPAVSLQVGGREIAAWAPCLDDPSTYCPEYTAFTWGQPSPANPAELQNPGLGGFAAFRFTAGELRGDSIAWGAGCP